MAGQKYNGLIKGLASYLIAKKPSAEFSAEGFFYFRRKAFQ